MIESYKFGRIVIDKILYEKDVIVFPHRVQSEWWRKEGHRLQLEDIREAFEEFKPNILVVGKGKFGMMKIDPGVERYCTDHQVELHEDSTDKAVKRFNRVLLTSSKVLGAFHLTC